jgi:hypothetical protein
MLEAWVAFIWIIGASGNAEMVVGQFPDKGSCMIGLAKAKAHSDVIGTVDTCSHVKGRLKDTTGLPKT